MPIRWGVGIFSVFKIRGWHRHRISRSGRQVMINKNYLYLKNKKEGMKNVKRYSKIKASVGLALLLSLLLVVGCGQEAADEPTMAKTKSRKSRSGIGALPSR